MGAKTIRLEIEDGLARITLDRPAAANALDLEMARELSEATLSCDEDPGVRAVLLTATGRIFCAGGDLQAFAGAGDALPRALKELTGHLHGAISRLARMRAPVVSAVNGTAAGAGLGLACAADLVVAGASTKFTMAYTRVGLVPDGSSTYFLPRLIGMRRTLDLMLTNRVLSAEEALEWGLVTRVVPDDALQSDAEALARGLAAGPTQAFGAVKRLVHESANDTLESQMERESRAIADAARTSDAREGIAAFLEKRKPHFTGE